VDEEHELYGLDYHEHGMEAYGAFPLRTDEHFGLAAK